MLVTSTTVPTAHGPMDVYEAAPTDDAVGAVIVVQEAFGVNDHVRDVTRRFAAEGYHAVAPAFFHRTGSGVAAYDDLHSLHVHFEGLDDEAILIDLDAALDRLWELGYDHDRVAIVGFCFGGRVSFLASIHYALSAAVGFYGGGIVSPYPLTGQPPLVDRVPELTTPWLGLYGDLDEGIPVADVERLRSALAAAPVDAQIRRYADAGHAFHSDGRPSYHEPSARDAWDRALRWMSEHRRA